MACRLVTAELSSQAGVDVLADAVDDADAGRLMAVAGFGASGRFIDADSAEEAQMLMLNCCNVLEQCRVVARRFSERGRGGIVLLSFVLALMGISLSAYDAVTKACARSRAEARDEERRSAAVDEVALAPGATASGFATRARRTMPVALTPRTVAVVTLSVRGKRATVRPGWLSKVLGQSLTTAPHSLRVKLLASSCAG